LQRQASAADPFMVAPYKGNSLLDRPTLTDNWFGQNQAMHDAGLDLRCTWSQFYQGLANSMVLAPLARALKPCK
jgi:hypothetical protein